LIIQNSIKDNADADNLRVPMQIDKSKMLFSDLKIPAVLVECGFLSNEAELALLKQTDYQKKMAFSIYCGILEYFKEKDDGGKF
jgi:N-acetylmuramoyl-L-alanine amidase